MKTLINYIALCFLFGVSVDTFAGPPINISCKSPCPANTSCQKFKTFSDGGVVTNLYACLPNMGPRIR